MISTHVSLFVSEIDKSVDFYTRFFGQEPTKVKPRYAKYELEEAGLVISFIEKPDAVRADFGHLGFRVDSALELEQKLASAREKNLVALEENGTACCYARQDKFWVADPDGYRWEIYLVHEDVEFNDPHYRLEEEIAETSNCC